jgi:TRAP-type C4-dicarboxylate transport system permease small subunit
VAEKSRSQKPDEVTARRRSAEEISNKFLVDDLAVSGQGTRSLPAKGGKNAREAKPPDDRPIAIFCSHGMGQQIKFSTIDAITKGILDRDSSPSEKTVVTKLVKMNAEPDGIVLSRAEIAITPGDKEVKAHIYEGYWAPMTEGKIDVRGVVDFLRTAGLQGVTNGAKGFGRWLFGKSYQIDTPSRNIFYLFLALLVVAALIVMNSTIVLVAVTRSIFEKPPEWFSDSLIKDLTTTFNFVVSFLGAFTVALVVSYLLRKFLNNKAPSRRLRKTWSVMTLLVFLPTVAVVILGAVSILMLFARHVSAGEPLEVPELWPPVLEEWLGAGFVGSFNQGFDDWAYKLMLAALLILGFFKGREVVYAIVKDFKDKNPHGPLTFFVILGSIGLIGGAFYLARKFSTVETDLGSISQVARQGLAWPLIIVASVKIRQLLVQFVGDVAIYVTPHKLDSYFELRDEIKSKVGEALKGVFELKDEAQRLAYRGVYIVGHSLGSVIAYDVLNGLINDDVANDSTLEVAHRTKLLLTFGSPLDKTAFLFGNQRGNRATRAALTGSIQPLIRDYQFRPNRWVNIWSRWDIISGQLDLYDPPPGAAGLDSQKKVENKVDENASILLGAHTEYWSNSMVYQVLYDSIGEMAV